MNLESRLRSLEKKMAATPASRRERYLREQEQRERQIDKWCAKLASGADPGPPPSDTLCGWAKGDAWHDELVKMAVMSHWGIDRVLAGEWPPWAPERARPGTLELCEVIDEKWQQKLELRQRGIIP